MLAASRHGNKLRTGHSRGNRFSIVVRGGDLAAARAAAEALAARGLPNFFGAQRFGADGRNADLGRAILLGSDDPEARRASRDRFLRRLALSAWQSLLFNRWLAERMADGLFARGPGRRRHEEARHRRRVHLRGPGGRPAPARAVRDLAGRPHVRPQARARRRARPGSGRRGSWPPTASPSADLARGGGETEGTRRAARIPVAVALEPVEGGYRASFDLPRGSYATVVMARAHQVGRRPGRGRGVTARTRSPARRR